MFFTFRNRAKKNSFTTLNLTFLLLKTMFDSISRILLYSTWLYVINDGQFSSTKTVIAYYSTLTLLLIFNAIINKQKDYTSARTWIGKQHFCCFRLSIFGSDRTSVSHSVCRPVRPFGTKCSFFLLLAHILKQTS